MRTLHAMVFGVSLVGLVGTTLAWIGPAAACEPIVPRSASVPVDGALDVRRDTVIVWNQTEEGFSAVGDPAVRVVRTGQPVAVAELPLSGLVSARAFRLLEPLPAGEEIAVGHHRRFQTGDSLAAPPPTWTLEDTRYAVEEGNGCSQSSCEGLEIFAVVLRGESSGQPPLFHVFLETGPGAFDPASPVFAFMQAWDTGAGRLELGLTRIPGLDFGSRVFVVPVGPSGALGAPVGPIAMEREGGGCSIAPHRGGRLLLLGLLLVALKLGLGSRATARRTRVVGRPALGGSPTRRTPG